MTAEILERADRRALKASAAIREALAAGDTRKALNAAILAVQAAAKQLREDRPADGALTDAEIAGRLLVTAARLQAHRPGRPAGCHRVPRAEDLLAACEQAVVKALEEGEGND